MLANQVRSISKPQGRSASGTHIRPQLGSSRNTIVAILEEKVVSGTKHKFTNDTPSGQSAKQRCCRGGIECNICTSSGRWHMEEDGSSCTSDASCELLQGKVVPCDATQPKERRQRCRSSKTRFRHTTPHHNAGRSVCNHFVSPHHPYAHVSTQGRCT
jgi:hypothetical protein